MKANTLIYFENEEPKRIKEEANFISNCITNSNYNHFHFIEVTEVFELASDLDCEEKIFINIKYIMHFKPIL